VGQLLCRVPFMTAVAFLTLLAGARAGAAQAEPGDTAPTAVSGDGQAAGVGLPDTAAGEMASAYLEAFNSGSDTALERFFTTYCSATALARVPAAARAARHKPIQEQLGHLEVRKVLEARSDALGLLAQSRGGDWLRVGFELEPAPPHGLLGIRIEPADSPDEAQARPPATDAELVSAIDSILDKLLPRDEFSGVVLVARGDRTLYLRAVGLADRGLGVPNRTGTAFNLGSLNKLFTAIAVGQLIEAGKLDPADTIGKLLPNYPNQAAAKVTVRQLLEMRSGIGDFFGERFEATPKDKIRALSDYLPLFADQPLAFEPGTQNLYSNGGYLVLGLIVEKISGQSYFDYVREHLFKPLGMLSTDSFEADAVVPNLAMGYQRSGPGGPLRANIYSRPARGSSAGGGYSTAEDMLRFGRALERGSLLRPETVRVVFGEMWPATPGPELKAGRIGGAWAGGAPGINAFLETDARTEITIVSLANLSPPAAGRVARTISAWLSPPRAGAQSGDAAPGPPHP
jgi:CubicO group peptidase (beta-lactamase class C family)